MNGCVCVSWLDILSRPGGGQFLRWPWSLAVERFAVWGQLLPFVLRLSTFFFLGFSACFTTVPVDFFFLSRNRLRPANLAAAFGDHKFRLFSLYLFAHTNKNTHTYRGALFSHNHTHTHGHGRSAALPYDDGSKLRQNPDDIIILQHLSRP